VSEPMTDLDWWAATRYPSADEDWTPARPTGRHAYDEDAAETPIFHALSTGAWRTRSHEPAPPSRSSPPARSAQPSRGSSRPAPDPVEAFRRDPLTMPIPEQAAASTEAARRAAFGAAAPRAERSQPAPSREPERTRQPEPFGRREVSDSGRHHRRRPPISSLL
jgi:hypothetical protein